MTKIAKVVALATTALFTMVTIPAATALAAVTAAIPVAGGPPGPEEKKSVSAEQYRVLTSQCRYADTAEARRVCRKEVTARYVIGAAAPDLDCRTYSGVTVCGPLTLGPKEQQCVERSVTQGLAFRRAEVECYAFA
ncbi:hypothetical protein Skr01_06340 [Sphaerisporangium krabiense]|uniref:Subtilisin inhibitor domain-containing protein n=1 Tax=Sphaerisporangium krabiense TaxID=763782 RepID=A0A7W9DSP8_9ACTN|nr:hypothetical protein [Sphaerisporangium krabiense]MBB5628615.1 hypothetical protein [Sphaerisporangium krabiense]GII60549.1 hypothetical protein Skr01_06340 [Sphaerisporangium krabiense]